MIDLFNSNWLRGLISAQFNNVVVLDSKRRPEYESEIAVNYLSFQNFQHK